MKLKNLPLQVGSHWRLAGFSLVEVMVAMMLFAILSIAICTSALHQRRQSESIMSQVIAQSVAEGILEQIRRAGFTALSNYTAFDTTAPLDCPATGTETFPLLSPTYTTYRSVELKFLGIDTDNLATVQTFNLYWAAGNTLYVEVGERSDPSDLASTMLGVVLDMDYKSGSTVLRPRRYMKMMVNLTRKMNTNASAVEIVLRYRWALPLKRTGAGLPIYSADFEIRTIVSKISTY